MKKIRISILMLVLLCLSVCVGGCNEKQLDDSKQTDNERISESKGSIEDEYIINGFDIRSIKEYPEIESAIRMSANVENGDLTRDDFLSVTNINLNNTGVQDISPLAALINLTEVYLGNNNISDLSPLYGLINITELWLVDNDIVDISPLANLKNLEILNLDVNSIEDLSPLSELTSIRWLSL